MKVAIVNDHIRGRVSNEDTLWSRLVDGIPDSVGISLDSWDIPLYKKLAEIKPDLVIQNANLGKLHDYPTISFLQDPFIEMQKYFETSLVKFRVKIRGRELFYPKMIQKQVESFIGNIRVANSHYMAYLYRKYALFQVIPMGVDTELFKPIFNETELKNKYGIPLDKTVKIFVGSKHAVKGWNEIKRMISENSNVFWILVLKDELPKTGKNYKIFNKLPQDQLAELYNCADKLVSRSKTESFGLAMVEAMMCNVPVDHTNVGVFWDWNPDMIHPRKQAIEHGLDIKTCIGNWKILIDKIALSQKEVKN